MKFNKDSVVVIMAVLCAVLIVAGFMKAYYIFSWASILCIMFYAILGGQNKGSMGPMGPVILILSAVLLAGFTTALSMNIPLKETAGLVLGFHPGTAVLVYIIWPIPILLGIAYGLNFEKFILTDEDFEKVRALRVTDDADITPVSDSGKTTTPA